MNAGFQCRAPGKPNWVNCLPAEFVVAARQARNEVD